MKKVLYTVKLRNNQDTGMKMKYGPGSLYLDQYFEAD